MAFFDGVSWFFVLTWVLTILFWAGVVAVAYLAIRWLARQGGTTGRDLPREDTALELLRQRYARGEIDATEFEERKRTLGG